MIKQILWKLISKSSCTMHIHQKISRFSMNPAMNSFESQVIKKYFLHTKAIVSLWVGDLHGVFSSPIFREFKLEVLVFLLSRQECSWRSSFGALGQWVRVFPDSLVWSGFMSAAHWRSPRQHKNNGRHNSGTGTSEWLPFMTVFQRSIVDGELTLP